MEQILNFLVLMWVMNLILYRPIRNMLARRQTEMEGLENSISDYHSQAAQNRLSMEEGAVQAREQGSKEKDSLRAQGAETERIILQETSHLVEEKLKVARKEAEMKLEYVREALQEQVAAFSREVAGRILGRKIA